jgi:hypothetical protein
VKEIISIMFDSDSSSDDESSNHESIKFRPSNAGPLAFHQGTEEALFLEIKRKIEKHKGLCSLHINI